MTNRTELKDISGIVLLNKPRGISSNKALQLVKRHFTAAKAGHVGTLDPLASGILPLCLGEATKFAHILQASTKTYQVTVTFGTITASGDAEGEVLATNPIPDFTEQDLQLILQQFTGQIQQIPPMFSALKVNGQPLYKLARQGKIIERQARTIFIEQISLLNYTKNSCIIEVTCSKGSYMRTLAEDIGKAMGCGAYMSDLLRSKLGKFTIAACIDLATLLETANPAEATFLHSINIVKPLLAKNIILSDKDEKTLRYGQQIVLEDYAHLVQEQDLGLINQNTNDLIGLGKIIAPNILVSQRLLRQNTI